MKNIKKIISYWEKSLVDADRLTVDLTKVKSIKSTELIEIQSGKLSDTITNFYFKDNKEQDNDVIKVLLSPLVLKLKTEHGAYKGSLPEKLIPLWVPAKLDKEGFLSIDKGSFPWIPRNYLEPSLGNVMPIGTIEALDSFLSKKNIPQENWGEFWNYVEELFKYVTAQKLDNYIHVDYSRTNTAFITDEVSPTGISNSIIELYNDLSKMEGTKKLLQRYASLSDVEPIPSLDKIGHFDMSSAHIGQMSSKFSVSKSQRDTIHHFLTMEDGDILAVNGPPGTGKTTLLQSIISTLWVEAAYKEADPPIIVVSSTNNQAVTNVIDSFGKVDEIANSLGGRWVPNVHSYGLYLSSASKKKNPNLHTVSPTYGKESNDGFPSEIENEAYLSSAENFFLDKCNDYAGRKFNSVTDAMSFIHQRLTETVDQIKKTTNVSLELYKINKKIDKMYPEGFESFISSKEVESREYNDQLSSLRAIELAWTEHTHTEPWWYLTFLKFPFVQRKRESRNKIFFLSHQYDDVNDEAFETKLKLHKNKLEKEIHVCLQMIDECEKNRVLSKNIENELNSFIDQLQLSSSEDLLEQLDYKCRYKAFKLASHYWEAKWLLELREQVSTKYKENKSESNQRKKWLRYAKLTPCFVSTLHMVPTFFKAWQGNTIRLYEFIDLLIIDEAGQVSPEVAGASFSLAKKALIIGDTLQIEPIWSIPTSIDLANIMESGVALTIDKAEQNILDKGMGASNGSVMTIAQRASKYQTFEDVKGMYLVEHRRCVPEIINYCNDLAYNGRLVPHRESIKDYPLPHMGYAHIQGVLEKVGGSYRNPKEANVIVSWILDHRASFEKLYPEKKIEEIIAVVTPFKQQAILIQSALRKENLEDIVVGTVHALQGAERPIVIFSSVYDSSENSGYFFDRGLSMLNVAVSRAQDSFLVFGEMSIFDRNLSSPSGILAKYLFANEENEIKNIKIPEQISKNVQIVEHIRDLEAHRQTLTNSVLAAKREIHIVSPFLSSKAIEQDNLEVLFAGAIRRGVKVNVYTDNNLNEFQGCKRTNFTKAKETLEHIGVNLVIMDRIHNKSFWIDNSLLIEGSFNWLSARRKLDDPWCRYETSLVYRGEEVQKMIKDVHEDILKRNVLVKD